jgi:deoxycytidylate deaminase
MCAKLLVQAGISMLFAIENGYSSQDGLEFVMNAGIPVRTVKALTSP